MSATREKGADFSLRFQRTNNLCCDAHRDDGKCFVVHANEKLIAFIELESAVGACRELA
jgi:hypothetical protein